MRPVALARVCVCSHRGESRRSVLGVVLTHRGALFRLSDSLAEGFSHFQRHEPAEFVRSGAQHPGKNQEWGRAVLHRLRPPLYVRRVCSPDGVHSVSGRVRLVC